ncbi:hypothetical protein KJ765_01260 [Candidatus Micrarchaeota archaeon]|nr:hypothetical protein [Candidatus Micrarchaeota archaeon]
MKNFLGDQTFAVTGHFGHAITDGRVTRFLLSLPEAIEPVLLPLLIPVRTMNIGLPFRTGFVNAWSKLGTALERRMEDDRTRKRGDKEIFRLTGGTILH